MPGIALIEGPVHLQDALSAIEEEVLAQVEEQSVIGLDTLVRLLPQHSWNRLFHAVDRLARRGAITLRRHRSDYTLFSIQYAA